MWPSRLSSRLPCHGGRPNMIERLEVMVEEASAHQTAKVQNW
jgi:hypothetical protein